VRPFPRSGSSSSLASRSIRDICSSPASSLSCAPRPRSSRGRPSCPSTTPGEFFDCDADALLTTAEAGTPLTRFHPFYSVAVLQASGHSAASCVYALARDCDDASLMFVDYWLAMEERRGALRAKYDYWVLGRNTGSRTARWSVVRDVLHWVA
jgi:hypothetical protein